MTPTIIRIRIARLAIRLAFMLADYGDRVLREETERMRIEEAFSRGRSR